MASKRELIAVVVIEGATAIGPLPVAETVAPMLDAAVSLRTEAFVFGEPVPVVTNVDGSPPTTILTPIINCAAPPLKGTVVIVDQPEGKLIVPPLSVVT